MRIRLNILTAVIVVGALAHVACAWLTNRWQEHVDFATYPDWLNYVRSLFGWRYDLVLGMSIGWFAGHAGATAGASAALIGRLVYCVIDRPLYQGGDFTPYGLGHEIQALIASAVLGAVFGLAGEYLRIKRSSKANARDARRRARVIGGVRSSDSRSNKMLALLATVTTI